jgi:hypothetical protein
MDRVRIDLPAALLRAAHLKEENLSFEVAQLLALELYREEKVSLGRAAELCETPTGCFHGFCGQAWCSDPKIQLRRSRRGTTIY